LFQGYDEKTAAYGSAAATDSRNRLPKGHPANLSAEDYVTESLLLVNNC
jgi:hypothetical protein